MKTQHFIAVGAVLVSLGLSAAELDTPQQFQQLDNNNDGTVSIIEASGQLELLRNWTKVDTDLNGELEISEFSAFETAVEFVPDDSMDEDSDHIGAAPH